MQAINLGPLQPQGAFEMVSYILASELAPLIHEQSSGNPLYVVEITRWLQRTRKITAADLENILQISDILMKLVLSDLESLPETQREIAVATMDSGSFLLGPRIGHATASRKTYFGVDMERVTPEDIEVTGNRVSVQLPTPTILDSALD